MSANRERAPAIKPSPSQFPRHWLMKSEPDVYSIDDLRRDGFTPWTGVRNYQARNFMRDDMKVGDLVLFYHSNAAPPGVAGVGRVSRSAYPDASALDPASPYFDAKASPENPIWMMVDVAFVEKFPGLVSLDALRTDPHLASMLVLKRGMRLSVQPVAPEHFRRIRLMGRASPSLRILGQPVRSSAFRRYSFPAEAGTTNECDHPPRKLGDAPD